MKAEKKLQDQNELLNHILESISHPFYVIDARDYTIKMTNTVSGVSNTDEMSTCYALIHNNDKPCSSDRYPCPLELAKKTKQAVIVEHILYDKDGKARYYEVHGDPVFDSRGNIIQFFVQCIDITERKHTEEELIKKQLRLELMLQYEHLLTNIAYTFNAADSFHEILFEIFELIKQKMNLGDVFLCYFNSIYVVSDLKGADTKEFKKIRNETVELSNRLMRTINNGESVNVSNTSELVDNEKKFFQNKNIFSFFIMPIKIDGKTIDAICFAKNHEYIWKPEEHETFKTISEMFANAFERYYNFHTRLEAEKKHVEAMQFIEKASRLASIGVMAAGINHEINQPLTAIKFNVDGLLYWEKNNKGFIPEIIIEG